MDIRADLVLDNLKEKFSTSHYGKKNKGALLRPVFYNKSKIIEKSRIYIVRADLLPPLEQLDATSLLICAEGTPSIAYQHSGIPLIVVHDSNVMDVFSEVLDIYERYDIWEKTLQNILSTSADFTALIRASIPVLRNDICITDRDLQLVTAAVYKKDIEGKAELLYLSPFELMSLDLASKYQRTFKENIKKTGSYYSDGCYCVNLISNGAYWGNISLFPRIAPLRPSDPYVFDILSSAVQEALQLRIINKKEKSANLPHISRQILDGELIDAKQLEAEYPPLEHSQGRFVVLCMRPLEETHKVSPHYICQAFSKRYEHLTLFEYNDEILGVKDFAKCKSSYPNFLKSLSEDLRDFQMKAGLSNRFDKLAQMRMYYQQAQYVLEFGLSGKTETNIFLFQDYALTYLLVNSSGIFPAEYLCPQGLLALRQYDRSSSVDYWGTLRCYLDMERNLAKTSTHLNIHRNTAIQRIERIQSILGLDLDNPMNRLWVRISMWLSEQERKDTT